MKLKNALAGAIVLVLTFLPGAASATGSAYVVSVGGSAASSSYALNGSTTGAVTLTLQRTTPPHLAASCSGANLSGTGSVVNGGTSGGPAPTDIFTLPTVNFSSCATPGGTASVVVTTPMEMHGLSPATAAATDALQVHLDGINLTISAPTCVVTVSGTAKGVFTEATQRLSINETGYTGDLTYTVASGCVGILPASGNANLAFTMNISTAGGAVNVMP